MKTTKYANTIASTLTCVSVGVSLAMVYILASEARETPGLTGLIALFIILPIISITAYATMSSTNETAGATHVETERVAAYDQMMRTYQEGRTQLNTHAKTQLLNTLDAMETSIAINALENYRRNNNAA